MATGGGSGGYGVGLGKPEDIDAATAYNLELSRQMTVPEKIVVADRIGAQPSPAFAQGSAVKRTRKEDIASATASPMLDSQRMNVPERISYANATPGTSSMSRSALRGRLPDLDDAAMQHSPAMAMVTPPERLTVADQLTGATPNIRAPQPRAASPLFSDEQEEDFPADAGNAVSRMNADGKERDIDGDEDDDALALQHGHFDYGQILARKGVEQRIASLEERVAELERSGGGSRGMSSGDRTLALLMFAFWMLNPIMLYVLKKSR